MLKPRLVITGNPGVGKHTCARLVSAELQADIIDINKLALENQAIAEKTDHGYEVDLRRLRRAVVKEMGSKKSLVLVGHLAPYVVKPAGGSMVVVLRRAPYELQKTLEKRGYSHAKVIENVSSEFLGVSMYDALKAFGRAKVAEFDTT